LGVALKLNTKTIPQNVLGQHVQQNKTAAAMGGKNVNHSAARLKHNTAGKRAVETVPNAVHVVSSYMTALAYLHRKRATLTQKQKLSVNA
jgi:hypothetical protein